MKKINANIPSNDNIHKLNIVAWIPDDQIKAVLQISHGMIEMIDKYDEFATYLSSKGIAVYGNDHLGHGLTAGTEDDLGYFCPEHMSATVVADLHKVTLYVKEQHPDVPYYLMGHSMGSFMARRYLMTYGDELDGAIISGTGSQPKPVLIGAKAVAFIIKGIKGDRHRTKLLKKLAFGAYQSRIDNPRTPMDWLTRDEKIVDFCMHNKYCNFEFTVNGYRTLFDVLTFIQNKKNISKIPKNLPITLIAGDADPVGNYGKDNKAIYNLYKEMGIKDISLRIYPDCRHELTNEINRKEVYEYIEKWIIDR